MFPQLFRKIHGRTNDKAEFKIEKHENEDASRFRVKEYDDGELRKEYEAPNIPNRGKWAILIKNDDKFTLVPLTKKLIFKQIIQEKDEFDNEQAIKNTLLLMRNRKVKKEVKKKKVEKLGPKKGDDDSDNGKESSILPFYCFR